MNPFTLSMWSSVIPLVVTERTRPSRLSLFRGVQGTCDGDFDEVCVIPEGKSAILLFYLFALQVLFSVASCGA